MRQGGFGNEPEYRRKQKIVAEHQQNATQHEDVVRTIAMLNTSIDSVSAEHAASRQQSARYEEGKRTRDWFTFAALIATAAAAILTLNVSHCDNRAIIKESRTTANQQHNDTLRTLAFSQRAYVFSDITDWQGVPNGPGNIFIKHVTNSGNTATRKMMYSIQCKDLPSTTPVNDPFDLFRWNLAKMSPNVIGAHQTKGLFPSDAASCDITESVFPQIRGGTITRYEAGQIIYYDYVNTACRHVTEFAEKVVINFGVISAVPQGNHNCADEDCPDERACP
jgi:hypothetical protein